MLSTDHYIAVFKNGKICDFDKKAAEVDCYEGKTYMIKDAYGRVIAVLPQDSIYCIFSSSLENHSSFYL